MNETTQSTGRDIATMDEAQAARALAKADRRSLGADGSGVMPVIPRDAHEAAIYAKAMVNANQVPDAYKDRQRNPNASLVAAGILKGLEVGLPPQTALGALMPINGRFTVWGDGAQALVQQSDMITDYEVEWFGPEPDETLARAKWPGGYGVRVKFWRKGVARPYIGEFTVAMARRANLWNKKGPWELYSERMLFNRARAFALRDGFADKLLGMGIFEEQRDVFGDPNDPANRPGAGADNSALDDDLTEADTRALGVDDLSAAVSAHIDGLKLIDTLEKLSSYQTTNEATALSKRISVLEDDGLYVKFTAANSQRFQEIDRADQQREREAAEASAGEDEAAEVIVEEGEQPGLGLDGEEA